MGCRSTESGISVQFCHTDGTPDGAPLYGRYSRLYGRPHKDVLSSGSPISEDEDTFRGSDDWLTLIAVADTSDKLEQMLRETTVSQSNAQTSHSSRRVTLELHIGGLRQTYENLVTIASGPIASFTPQIVIDVAHVKVLPPGTKLRDLGEKNPLVVEFTGGAIAFKNR